MFQRRIPAIISQNQTKIFNFETIWMKFERDIYQLNAITINQIEYENNNFGR